jgi:hypothetical protein
LAKINLEIWKYFSLILHTNILRTVYIKFVYFQICTVCEKFSRDVETLTTEIQASVAVKGEIKFNIRKDRGIGKI